MFRTGFVGARRMAVPEEFLGHVFQQAFNVESMQGQTLFQDMFRFEAGEQDDVPQRPATSAATLQMLPTITVSERDINEHGDLACSICLGDFRVGESAARIPCGHIFHEDCIKEWLKSSNQCAVCRWELQTDDLEHEKQRKQSNRKLRLRVSELGKRTVRELRFLAAHVGVNTHGCLEKRDLVDRIVTSGLVEVAPGVMDPETLEVVSCEHQAESMQVSGQSSQKIDVKGRCIGSENPLEHNASFGCQSLRDVTGNVQQFVPTLSKLLGKNRLSQLFRTDPALADISSVPLSSEDATTGTNNFSYPTAVPMCSSRSSAGHSEEQQ